MPPQTSFAHLRDYRCRVVDNRPASDMARGSALKVITFKADESFACEPGQFVMIDMPDTRFFFRRPMSVFDVNADGSFSVFYRVVGKGTQMLADVKPGTGLKVLGPLGNSFTPPPDPGKAILIGGGIGIAPLYLFSKKLGKPMRCYYGVRSAADVGVGDALKKVFGGHLSISTDDGSEGFRGNVCQMIEKDNLKNITHAYICGPTRMMEASVELLKKLNPKINIEVSLEEHMPCGTGACGGCVVFRNDGRLPSKVCVEGPVFNAFDLRWHAETVQPKQEGACLLS